MKDVSLVATAASVALLACAGSAAAVVQNRVLESTAVGLCQGALPAFETQIRKRPLAVQNEGAANAFVTCSLLLQDGDDTGFELARVLFRTVSGSATSLSCTGVWGGMLPTSPIGFATKSVTTPAGGQAVEIVWDRTDMGTPHSGFYQQFFSVSCAVPPGVAITEGWMTIHD